MAEWTLLEAVNHAFAREMETEPDVVILGEDIGVNGGVFRATDGLQDRFGAERIIDTPLAESVIVGMAIGMAAQGLRPVAELQFMGFIYPAVDQIVNHASRLRNRTRGRITCPMVIRAPFGGGIHAPEHHSESTEAMFAHIPGVRVVIPSSPARAYGLLLAAIRDPDPAVFLEPKRIYRLGKAGGRGTMARPCPWTVVSFCATASTSPWSVGVRRSGSAWKPPANSRTWGSTPRSSTWPRSHPWTWRQSSIR